MIFGGDDMKTLVSLFLLLIVLAVSGCSTVSYIKGSDMVEDETQLPAGIVPGEYQNAASIIFLDEVSMDKDIVSCLENRIEKHNPDQDFISYNQFVNTMFPDLFEHEVPREQESLPRLLTDEKFHKDVLSWGVRYLIFVSGTTQKSQEADGLHCGGFPPACLGFDSWHNKTRLTASILDLHQKETVADNIENTFEDTSWFGIAMWLPMGFPSSTEYDSCEDIGNRLGKILLDRSKQ